MSLEPCQLNMLWLNAIYVCPALTPLYAREAAIYNVHLDHP